jgi:hypothetical protein
MANMTKLFRLTSFPAVAIPLTKPSLIETALSTLCYSDNIFSDGFCRLCAVANWFAVADHMFFCSVIYQAISCSASPTVQDPPKVDISARLPIVLIYSRR